jgi:hypothetical protein
LKQANSKKTVTNKVTRPVVLTVESSAVQAVSHGMSLWFLLLAAGLAVLCFACLYFGLFVVGSTFGSILLVSITLYAFFKYWPEDEFLKPSPRPKKEEPAPSEPRHAMIPLVRSDGPPKVRFMTALRDASRRQDGYKISKQGAERFAKTIRYLLQNS